MKQEKIEKFINYCDSRIIVSMGGTEMKAELQRLAPREVTANSTNMSETKGGSTQLN